MTDRATQAAERIAAFDKIIEDAPVDFLGTGSSMRHADKEEREWRERVSLLRSALVLTFEQAARAEHLESVLGRVREAIEQTEHCTDLDSWRRAILDGEEGA